MADGEREHSSQAEPPSRHSRHSRPRRALSKLGTLLIGVIAGLLFVIAATSSQGSDLRPTRQQDLADLAGDQDAQNEAARASASAIQAEIDSLGGADPQAASSDALTDAEAAAGLTAVAGPAVQVTLTDAPLEVSPSGVDPDMLVVHQQDIQQVVDALWSGGAEAMTIQGVRVVSTTGIKCVGNTVILNGVPYSPPYVIAAIGDQSALEAALDGSKNVQIYKQYVTAYRLGYAQKRLDDVTMPAFAGSVAAEHATPKR